MNYNYESIKCTCRFDKAHEDQCVQKKNLSSGPNLRWSDCVCANHHEACDHTLTIYMEAIGDKLLNLIHHIKNCVEPGNVLDPQLMAILDAFQERTIVDLVYCGIPFDVYDQRLPTDAGELIDMLGVDSELDANLQFIINSGIGASTWANEIQDLCVRIRAEIDDGIDDFWTGQGLPFPAHPPTHFNQAVTN